MVATGKGAYVPSQWFTLSLVSTQRSRVGHDDYFDVDIEGDMYGGGIGGEGSGNSDDLVMGDNGGEGSGVQEVFSGLSIVNQRGHQTKILVTKKKEKGNNSEASIQSN